MLQRKPTLEKEEVERFFKSLEKIRYEMFTKVKLYNKEQKESKDIIKYTNNICIRKYKKVTLHKFNYKNLRKDLTLSCKNVNIMLTTF